MYTRLPDPEEIAQDLLRRSEQFRPPVDLKRTISLWPELSIVMETLKGAGYLVNLGVHGAEILVRAEDPPVRQRYTIAHELGHWLLTTSDDLRRRSGQATGAELEKWCDRFAASLLMPAPWVRRDIRYDGSLDVLNAVFTAPKLYDVSAHAFWLRVSEVTSISIAELGQTGEAIGIRKKFVSKDSGTVNENMVSQIVSSLSPRLLSGAQFGRVDFREMSMHAIHGLLPRRDETQSWLVCMLPADRIGRGEDSTNPGQ